MNQREAVRAFAAFMASRTPNPSANESHFQDMADKWSDAQKFEPGRQIGELRGEVKPAPMA